MKIGRLLWTAGVNCGAIAGIHEVADHAATHDPSADPSQYVSFREQTQAL